MNNIFVFQWRKFWELNFNSLSQCRKTYEMSNVFDSYWQIFESWITNFSHSVGKVLRWKQFCLTVPKNMRVEFQFCLRMSKKIWGEIQICVIVLKNSNSDWHFCLTLPKVLKVHLDVCLTKSTKIMRWITYLYLSDETFESWISIFPHNVEKLTKWVTFLTHIDKFLRVELQTSRRASENSEVKNSFVSQCRKIWELNFNFVSECRKKYEANYKFVSQCWKIQIVIDIFVSHCRKFWKLI